MEQGRYTLKSPCDPVYPQMSKTMRWRLQRASRGWCLPYCAVLMTHVLQFGCI